MNSTLPPSDRLPTIKPPPPVETPVRDTAFEAVLLNLSNMSGQARRIAEAANVIATESEAMAEEARQLDLNVNAVAEHDTAPESRR